MANYHDEIEAAYLTSRRQGDMMRDRERERSPHEDRRNRYRDDQYTRVPAQESIFNRMETPDRDNRGKGPKNYKRSDERIRENVCDLFCDDPYLDATDIDVEVKNGEVMLTGNVSERFEKRMAEHIAENIPGVVHVENRIRVNVTQKESYQHERVK